MDQDRISRLCESFYRCTQCKYHTGGLHDPLSLRLPIMVFFHPIGYGIIISILRLGVSVDSMIYRRVKAFRNLLRYCKVHVCDPQWQHIRRLASLHGIVVLQAVRSLTIYNFIKVVCSHTNPLTFRQPASFLPVAPSCRLNFSVNRTLFYQDLLHVLTRCVCCGTSVKLSAELAKLLCIPVNPTQAKACSKSASRSSIFSIPTDILKSFSSTPRVSLTSTGTSAWVCFMG